MIRRVSTLWALLALASFCHGQDLWCMNCREYHDINGDWIGTGRLDHCPCCKGLDCADAAEKANQLRSTYGRLRSRYDAVRQEIAALKSAGKDVPRALSNEEAKLNFDLGQLELQYAILKEECPAQVKGNLWDGAGGPVEGSPATADMGARAARAASNAAKGYRQLAHDEAHQLDVLLQFLGTAADGYAPPATGFNGERVQVAKQYSELATAFETESKKLAAPVRANESGALPKLEDVKPPKVQAPANASALVKQQAAALQSRLEANAYAKAYLQFLDGERASTAAGKAEEAKKFGRAAVKYAWFARQAAQLAERLERTADAAHQEALDASLAAADKKGLGVDELLKRFQASVKANGVPAELRQALSSAGLADEEIAAVGKRLLQLTNADVDHVLKARRERLKEMNESVSASDSLALEAQYMATRAKFHRPPKGKD